MISPLLANVALHGLEIALGVKRNSQGHIRGNRAVVRYADDFVVFCESRADAETVVGLLRDWLAVRGLTLSEDKTRIVPLSDGFDFLGFTVRRYKTPRTKTGETLLITPSDASVKRLRARLREEWRALTGQSVEAIAQRLTPLIRGWANYYRTQVATATFHALDHYMTTRELRYAKRRHPTKSYAWCKARYWGHRRPHKGDTWVFGNAHTGAYLLLFRWFKIERHVLVKGTASPDAPRLRDYWAQRRAARAKDLRPSLQRIAHNQGGVCRRCGESLFNGEDIHKHHAIPRAAGGDDRYTNLELVHLYCHQQIHGRAPERIEGAAHEPTRKWLRPSFA